jgi:hypothetical protein
LLSNEAAGDRVIDAGRFRFCHGVFIAIPIGTLCSNPDAFSAMPLNDREVTLRQARESHPYFGTLFRVPDSHMFWRNRAAGGTARRNGRLPTAKIERLSAHAELDLIWAQVR